MNEFDKLTKAARAVQSQASVLADNLTKAARAVQSQACVLADQVDRLRANTSTSGEAEALRIYRDENDGLRRELGTVIDTERQLQAHCDELHRENDALRTRLAAADSLIAEMKQREADRLSGVFPNANGEPCVAMPIDAGLRALAETRELLSASEVKYSIACRERNALKSAHAELVKERDQLRRDLELSRRDLEMAQASEAACKNALKQITSGRTDKLEKERGQLRIELEKARVSKTMYKTALKRFATRYDELCVGVVDAYAAVFGIPKPELTHEFYRAAIARLAQYAKARCRLNTAMAEVETATKQYESLASGPHSFTIDIVAELTERADRRAADDEARTTGPGPRVF